MKLYENKFELKKYGDESQITGLSLSYDYLKTLKSDKEFQDYLSSVFKSLPSLVQYVNFDKFKANMTIKSVDELDVFLGQDDEYNGEYRSYVTSNRNVLCSLSEDEYSRKYKINEKEVTKEEYLKFSEKLDQYHCIGNQVSTECSMVREIGKKHNFNIKADFIYSDSTLGNFPLSLNEFANDNLKTKLNLFNFSIKNDNKEYEYFNVFIEKVHGKTQYNIVVSDYKNENLNRQIIFTGVNDSSFNFIKEKFDDKEKFEELLEKCIPNKYLEKFEFEALEESEKTLEDFEEEYEDDGDSCE